MNNRIQELRKDHEEIIRILASTNISGLEYSKRCKILAEAGHLISEHLRKEDQYIYPILKKSAGDKATMASEFAENMKNITAEVLSFIYKYENPAQSTLDYASDYGRISILLKTRIRREENILYQEYEKFTEPLKN